jgi:HEPN domain-containing protein
MARKRYPPADPREWLIRARSNFARAKNDTVGALLEGHCFDAQQAAEKAIKAVFVHRGVSFPYIHDLAERLQRLERNGVKIPKYVREADERSIFALETRYPGLTAPVTKRRHHRVVRIAEAVLRWAERQIGKS